MFIMARYTEYLLMSLLAAPLMVHAAEPGYPARPIRILIPFPAGGTRVE